MPRRVVAAAGLAVAAVAIAALAGQEREYTPSCVNCPGTYIPNTEIQAYVKRAVANQLIDQQVRQVDIGKANVGVAVVHRGRLDNPRATVAEHDLVSEVYHVIDGGATLVLGPDLVGKQRRPSTDTTVRLLNGPGNNATAIRNGVSHQLKAGDVVVIPAGTGHQFTKIDDHITYLMVRVDPDKVTPPKTEADSRADLLTDGRTTAGGGAGAVASRPATAPTPAAAPVGAAPASSGGVVMQRNVSLAMAKAVAETTLAECKAKGFNTAAAVVDRAGQLMVMLRDEQATTQMAEMARRKAYTARMFRMSTMDFQKRTATDPTLAAQRDIADVLALGGGMPIQIGAETIGGVGSAGSNQETDEACARAGVARVADLLR
jgi:uncharacterized protein GlcG (DUF336 family)/mannose-6-phosphate isomerase-like protein (cupin superfamily)